MLVDDDMEAPRLPPASAARVAQNSARSGSRANAGTLGAGMVLVLPTVCVGAVGIADEWPSNTRTTVPSNTPRDTHAGDGRSSDTARDEASML